MKERRHTPHGFPTRRRGRREGRYLYTQGRKGRYWQVRLPHYLSIVFITPSKEVSLESIFQVALLSHIFKPRRRGTNTKFSTQQVPASSDFKSPEIRSYLPVLTSL